MRFKLLRRRLTISAPRMAVRSAMPWPLRWAGVAIMLGLCAAISLWSFEFGKSIAGLDSGAKEELLRLRADVAKLREERDKAQSVFNTSASLLTAEKAAQERMAGADSSRSKQRTGRCATTSASSKSSSLPAAQRAWPSAACRRKCSAAPS